MRPKTDEHEKLDVLLVVRLSKLEKRLLAKRSKVEDYRTLSDFCRAN